MSGPIQCNIKTSETRSRWCLCVLIQTRREFTFCRPRHSNFYTKFWAMTTVTCKHTVHSDLFAWVRRSLAGAVTFSILTSRILNIHPRLFQYWSTVLSIQVIISVDPFIFTLYFCNQLLEYTVIKLVRNTNIYCEPFFLPLLLYLMYI